VEVDVEVLGIVRLGEGRRKRGFRGMLWYLFEFSETPSVVFTRVVAGEICGGDVGDCFYIYAHDLAFFSILCHGEATGVYRPCAAALLREIHVLEPLWLKLTIFGCVCDPG